MLAERVKTWTQVWRKEGYDEGREEGHEEGLEEGLEKGRETQIRTLRRLLLRRFGALPEWAEARLTQATSAQNPAGKGFCQGKMLHQPGNKLVQEHGVEFPWWPWKHGNPRRWMTFTKWIGFQSYQ